VVSLNLAHPVESFEYFCQIPSKLILTISSYTVSKFTETQCMSTEAIKMLVQAFISCHMDYCNTCTLLYCINDGLVSWLQRQVFATGPNLWNSLPADLRQADINFQRFKWLMKTFLFGCWDRGALWLSVKSVPHKFSYFLTYLLTYLLFRLSPVRTLSPLTLCDNCNLSTNYPDIYRYFMQGSFLYSLAQVIFWQDTSCPNHRGNG